MVEFTKRFPVFVEYFTDDIALDNEVYSDIVTLTIDGNDIVNGDYDFTVYFTCSNPDINDSLYWQVVSVGSPETPLEFSVEPKDITDTIPVTYTTTRTLTTVPVPITLILQMRKEDALANDITLFGAGIRVERVR